jgi:hypothetical protein
VLLVLMVGLVNWLHKLGRDHDADRGSRRRERRPADEIFIVAGAGVHVH